MSGVAIAPLTAVVVALVGLGLERRLLPARGRRSAIARTVGTRIAGTRIDDTRIDRLGPPPDDATRSFPTAPFHRIARYLEQQLGRCRERLRRPAVPSDTEVATWCDRLARRVRTGDTLSAAIRAVEPPATVRDAVAPVMLALDRGGDLRAAVGATAGRSSALDAALTVIGACARLGGPAAEPLDRVAAALRRRVADAADRRTQSAQARTSAATLTLLPVGFLAAMTLTSASVRAGVASAPGAVSIGAGVVLNLAGWCWMRRIIGGAP
ncbi:MAG: type II secretion system F family protein [Ilumatobacteraceae bacterium]